MNPGPEDSSEDQYGRQDSRRYSGWTSAITITVIVIVLGLAVLVYELRYERGATQSRLFVPRQTTAAGSGERA